MLPLMYRTDKTSHQTALDVWNFLVYGILPMNAITQFVTTDSGQREQHSSGAIRDIRAGKGRFDLLPTRAIRRVAGVYERGAIKYAARNWEKGMPMSRYMDSALRHLYQYLEGQRDEDHLAQAAFNVLAMIDHEERLAAGQLPAEFDDLPKLTTPNVSVSLDETRPVSTGRLSAPSSS